MYSSSMASQVRTQPPLLINLVMVFATGGDKGVKN